MASRAALAFGCAMAMSVADASEYTVSPMRMELDRESPSTVLTLANTGNDRIDFQLTATEWTQDPAGRDHYSSTKDLVFFPRILSLQPNEARVIRIGVRSVPESVERTFRLFVEKIPAPNPEPLPPGAQVSVNVRFALPVFVKPAVRKANGEITDATLRGGVLALSLHNTGNEHLRMDEGIALAGRDAQGNAVFTGKIEERYVLAGVTKRLETTIPRDLCTRLVVLELSARTEQLALSRRIDVNRASCE